MSIEYLNELRRRGIRSIIDHCTALVVRKSVLETGSGLLLILRPPEPGAFASPSCRPYRSAGKVI